jgi:hypothetical protein
MFVKCQCQHCGGKIEFDSNYSGEMAECPHCHQETFLVKAKKMFIFWIAFFVFVSSALVVLALFIPNSITWEKSGAIQQGDVEVKIDSAAPGMLFLDNGEGLGVTPTMNYFLIKVRVTNQNPNKKMDFSTWRSSGILDAPTGTLSDNFGNSYKRIVFTQPLLNCRDETTIYPNSSFTDTLIFELPVQNTQWLHLSLAANNFGGEGTLRFEIAR